CAAATPERWLSSVSLGPMKVLRVFAPLLAVLAISKSWAADSRTIAISSSSIESASVELHTVADPQFGAITIRATASADRHVKSLLLTYQSRTADVPADGLRDLRDADIASLRVIAVFSPPAKPLLLLNMD